MSSYSPISASANVHWSDGQVHVSIGDETWTVAKNSLDTLISLLEAGRSMAARPAQQVAHPVAPIPHEVPEPAPARTSSRGKRRSRKRVGDALILWMEVNEGWHHEDTLLQAVIENRMTDASPLRALKIALGKQRGSIFTDGGHGYWKLQSDENAGAPPQADVSPTVRQRILARSRDSQEAEAVPTNEPASMSATHAESPKSAGANEAKSERWTDVPNDEIARARRNLLGLGSMP